MAIDLGTTLPLLSLALALGLDSFRATIGLGALRPKLSSANETAKRALELLQPRLG